MSPTRPLHACPHIGCAALVAVGRCEAHGGPYPEHRWDTDRRPDVKRLNGYQTKLRRDALRRREPLCRLCSQQGRTEIGVIRDHVVPLAEGGTEDISNEQNLCKPCHDLKTIEESKRGKLRLR